MLSAAEPLIYSTTLDFSTIETMSETRERISEKIARRSKKPGEINIKLTPGGIRDIEFLVQCLQRLHGNREHAVKDQGTLLALKRLHEKDLLSTTEFSRLAHAYQFLRRVEHVLQFEHDRQTHTLPLPTAELDYVARRVRPETALPDEDTGPGVRLLQELNQHLETVRGIYERIVHAQRPLYYTTTQLSAMEHDRDQAEAAKNGTVNFEAKADEFSDELRQILRKDRVAEWAAQLAQLSAPLADELVRDPELVREIERSADHPARRYAFEGLAAPLNDIAGLRRFYRREMFRIQVRKHLLAGTGVPNAGPDFGAGGICSGTSVPDRARAGTGICARTCDSGETI